jgi:hypothetical protein
MRLYEFTNPSEYLLPETWAADFAKQTENILVDDTSDIADRHLRKKLETKKPTNTI